MAARAGGDVIVPKGADAFAAKRDGYAQAWRRLPPSVERVVVLRDTPRLRNHTLACVEQAMVGEQPPATACAVPRKRALVPDAQAAAAEQVSSRRVDVVDLTRFTCGQRECWPVIGSALIDRTAPR